MLDVVNLKKLLTSSILTEAQDDSKDKLAAVMIIIFGNEPMMLMIERSKTMNHHAGEISSPGGTWNKNDGASNAAARALYAKYGFAATGLRRNYYQYPDEDAVLYRRVIGSHQ